MEPVRCGRFGAGLLGTAAFSLWLAAGCTPSASPTRSMPGSTAAPASVTSDLPVVDFQTNRLTKERALIEGLKALEKSRLSKEAPPEPGPSSENVARPSSAARNQTEQPAAAVPPEPGAAVLEADMPLVAHPEKLVRLDPKCAVWVDPVGKQVVLLGEVCQRNAPLEMFACPRGTKEHESVVSIPTKAYMVHAGLVAVGAEPGRPVSFHPEYVPASGAQIDVTVFWKDAQGKTHSAKARDWVRNTRTKRAMTHPWVFAGSGFWKDEETGASHYQAESGDLICVSNFPSAMLDLPVPSTDQGDSLLFEAFTERIPPLGTPVTVVLAPMATPDKSPSSDEPSRDGAS